MHALDSSLTVLREVFPCLPPGDLCFPWRDQCVLEGKFGLWSLSLGTVSWVSSRNSAGKLKFLLDILDILCEVG